MPRQSRPNQALQQTAGHDSFLGFIAHSAPAAAELNRSASDPLMGNGNLCHVSVALLGECIRVGYHAGCGRTPNEAPAMRYGTTLLSVLLLGSVAHAGDKPKPVPEKDVQSWKDIAGASYGSAPSARGIGFPIADPFQDKVADRDGRLPAFKVTYKYLPAAVGQRPKPTTPELTAVPVPEVPFALYLYTWAGHERVRQVNRFPTLEALSCSGAQISEADFEHLKDLKNLRSLDLSLTPLKWDAPARLTVFPKLTDLNISGTQLNDETAGLVVEKLPALLSLHIGNHLDVTDRTADALSKHPALKHLDVSSTGVTDDGLKSLAKLPLQTLGLGRTKVTDAGMKSVGSMKSLETLQLYDTDVTDAGLAELSKLENLRQLNLHVKTAIGEPGLGVVCRWKGLEDLVIRLDSRVSEKSLMGLAKLPRVRTIHFTGVTTGVAALERLRKAMPNSAITWSK